VLCKKLYSIRARPLQHRLPKHSSDESDAHYGDLILHTEVRWLTRGKIVFRFQELLPASTEFLQDRGDLAPQLKYSQSLLDLALLTDLTAKLNDLNIELQSENKTIIKMIDTIDFFKGNLKLRYTQLTKGVPTHFQSIQSRADGTFNA
jgi:hypothetical protein